MKIWITITIAITTTILATKKIPLKISIQKLNKTNYYYYIKGTSWDKVLPRRTLHYTIFSSPKSKKGWVLLENVSRIELSAFTLPRKVSNHSKSHQQTHLRSKKIGAIITIQISVQKIFYRKYADTKMFCAVSQEMLNPGTPKFSTIIHQYYRSFAEWAREWGFPL